MSLNLKSHSQAISSIKWLGNEASSLPSQKTWTNTGAHFILNKNYLICRQSRTDSSYQSLCYSGEKSLGMRCSLVECISWPVSWCSDSRCFQHKHVRSIRCGWGQEKNDGAQHTSQVSVYVCVTDWLTHWQWHNPEEALQVDLHILKTTCEATITLYAVLIPGIT